MNTLYSTEELEQQMANKSIKGKISTYLISTKYLTTSTLSTLFFMRFNT